ncbi:hypothetical protein [Marinobacter sp. X15-166B]|uniref:hypothetical protein n=1 Tax=Marinobacter sp. X15-166B TaxID=1897620 RepID=UPI00085C6F6B|nr:hypothetical protein [Marinobacter sp. X15-166B]OEY66827.1 hypothetical protein BG841_10415 [Marinobacter sp. X15-166B]
MSIVAKLSQAHWRSVGLKSIVGLVDEINELGTGDTLALRLDPKGVIVSSYDCHQRQYWQESVFWDDPQYPARLSQLVDRLAQIRSEMELNMESKNACANP